MGEWITDEDEVKNFILAGYMEIYETSHPFSTRDSEIENFLVAFCLMRKRVFSIVLSLRRR